MTDVTHLTAAPGLLLAWRIPFDKAVRTQEIERRRTVGREIAALRREIGELHRSRR